jgi:hypothetical protein
MVNVTLDSQTLFAFPLAADRKSTSPDLWPRDRSPLATSSKGPERPHHDTDNRQRGAGGTSGDDALLISTDDESDYDDYYDDFEPAHFFPAN